MLYLILRTCTFLPLLARNCASFVSLVRDFTRSSKVGTHSCPKRVATMKSTRYTSAKRTQRRHERDERVRAGVPSVKLDWQCHICQGWYSNYRNHSLVHLQHCEKKEAARIASEERRTQVAPLPSPDRRSPFSSLNATSISRSPTREASSVGHAEQGEDTLEHPENSKSFEPLVLDQALVEDDESLGEFASIVVKS